ncbi:MAG: DNA mismatch repair protein MutS, partial [Firmicutes bacterium]|nr:DNA mismatch repair protein MutS [Bacillota bacterium]
LVPLLERLAGRVSFGSVNARDLIALKKSLAPLKEIKRRLQDALSPLVKELGQAVDELDDIKDHLCRAIMDDPPFSVRDGGIIKPGYNSEVDRLRTAGRDGRALMAALEDRERARTGIKSLKVGYNKVFGYYIEVTRANLSQVPPDYQRRQTLANAERFVTPELKDYEEMILGAEDRLAQLEYRLFLEIREALLANLPRIQRTADALARVDALLSLAEAATEGGYCRPVLNHGRRILIREGRHPVLEQVLGPGRFVPNDLDLDGEKRRLILLTGPNMAGKSTYMRQVALIVLMAQVGSFVPADRAEIGLVDRIFTRVGAADDLAGGQSTFMVEMNECREIVEGATGRSLIIMDEVGRGTSTYDGISIARALAEYINEKIGARTLFSTHYHELTDLEETEGVVNYTVAVKEEGDDIIFLRKVVPGKADRSYGIHVARLAGLPREILQRSKTFLAGLEVVKGRSEAAAGVDNSGGRPAPAGEHPVLLELRGMNVMEMTPLEAMNRLYQLQKRLNSCIL